MSFIISEVVHDGIVMAADSCLSKEYTKQNANGVEIKLHTVLSRSFEKLYSTPHNIGIAIGGASHTKDHILITRYLDHFLHTLDVEKYSTPKAVTESLMEFMLRFDANLDSEFHVCGYDKEIGVIPMPRLYVLKVKNREIKLINNNPLEPCMAYGNATVYPHLLASHVFNSNFANFSIQDAIDFAVFLIETTGSLLRFQGIGDIISGHIDVLVIRPSGLEWVSHKKFHVKDK